MQPVDAFLPAPALTAAFGVLAAHAISVEVTFTGGVRVTALLLTRGAAGGGNNATTLPPNPALASTARVSLAAPSGPALATAAATFLAAARGGGPSAGGTWRYTDTQHAARGPFEFARIAAWADAKFWPPGFLVEDVASGAWLPVSLAVAAGRVLSGESAAAAAAAAWPARPLPAAEAPVPPPPPDTSMGEGGGGAVAFAPSHHLPGPPGIPPQNLGALAAALDAALLAGLGPAAAACLAATHGPVWPDLVPDPPPWPHAGPVLANLRATWNSAVADWYGPARGARARRARDVTDALAKARSALMRSASSPARSGQHGPTLAALVAATNLAGDLLADFPCAGDSGAEAAVARAREAVRRVAEVVGGG